MMHLKVVTMLPSLEITTDIWLYCEMVGHLPHHFDVFISYIFLGKPQRLQKIGETYIVSLKNCRYNTKLTLLFTGNVSKIRARESNKNHMKFDSYVLDHRRLVFFKKNGMQE